MDLGECFRKGLIKKTLVDKELIKSLIEISNTKEIAVKSADITNITISAYVSLAYDSLRVVLEAICILNGYKVLSHICIGELVRDIIQEFDYEEFDRFRWIRNSINYYGEKIDFEQGKTIIDKIFFMRKRLIERYL